MVFKSNLDNEMSLSFKSITENVMFARNVGTTFLYNLNPTISFLNEIKTIISEGVTNAIIHGYKNEIGEVILNIGYNDEYIFIEIIDYGIGIKDINEAILPLHSSCSERSGLGFTLIEVFSDDMEIISKENDGTKLRIKKKIKGDFLCE